MDVIVAVDTLDLDAVMRRLAVVAEDVRNEILVEALDEGAAPIFTAMKEKCPIEQGKLKESLQTKRTKRKGLPALTIGPKSGLFKGDTFYGGFVELGHLAGSRKLGQGRKHVPAKPFMRNSFMEKRAEAVRDAQRHIADRLNRMAVSV